jgi:murein DD-endopeptidase MepM/ murein hydrolase activator NlpD
MGSFVGKLVSIVVGSLAAAALLASGHAAAEPAAPASGASARAFAIKVVVPGRAEAITAQVAAPPDAVAFGAGFAYPEDGSVLTSGSVTASASASATDITAAASASSEVTSLSIFGGEVTAAQVASRATVDASDGTATGDLSGAQVGGLMVGGQAVAAAAGTRVELGDWGYALVLAQGAAPSERGYRGFVTALEVHLNADHGGLPAGSAIYIGYAEASATAAEAGQAPAEPAPTTSGPSSEQPGKANAGQGKRKVPAILRRPIPSIEPRLTRSGYVFPVHGPASFTDTFGAGRAVVGWHHGEDIFVPIGAPVLAVARGTVFSVGWNDIGGNRLWLRDREGNEFYYAHLSAFSPLAINGAQVEAGDVLGFVGNSGDAETTPPHLHFEIHPVGLLGLGYDGVVPAYRYLMAWRRLEDVRFVAGAGWLPLLPGESAAPPPGAYLLSATDISSASGLEPGSLKRALAEPVSIEVASGEVEAGGALARSP